ncbi:MinD/ParA family ATP-binding protein [Spelaeicoccus albus]|uniref:MinD-like ATPase involved in chromosome partitioning or flagellar assembly n=1 Tax=Spelaeicoccus albus TaxID=1280376 RepID=A0A7Z0IHT2_9MICO|nr:MinD/ParA family protein [Spelaeicoccus albus]NYI67792.1 MinD-like ATPase involved in chromosome partitioning or flagellar assembly [Spelaeicoccus albus]
MPNQTDHIEVRTFADGGAAVGGERIDTAGFPDPYTATLAHVAAEAELRRAKVLTHGIDHAAGQDSWFYVTPDGEIELPEPVPQGASPVGSDEPESQSIPDDVPAPPAAPPRVGASSQPVPPASSRGGSEPESSARPESIVTLGAPGFTPPADPQPRSRRDARAADPLHADTTVFVRRPRNRPKHGARGALYTLSGGTVNLGPSSREQRDRELADRIARQLTGSHNTAILSLKGGIGKTSTTVGLGLVLAEYRGDPPMAIDANPDSGDLAERALGESGYQSSARQTITDLLADAPSIDSLTELSKYVQHAGRFHLVAGEQDPALSDSLTADEYLTVSRLISRYYSVVLTDCGTGVTHQAMSGILQTADNLIVAAGYAVSGANRARSTLRWLAGHGYEKLAREAIVVITDKDGVSNRVDKDAIRGHLSGYCRELIAVPNDKGVADGDLVSLDGLKPATRDAYRRLAAAVVDGYE